MKIIPREAGRVTYSTEIKKLKLVNFSKNQQLLVVGSILGDGCLLENWSKTNFRLSITHSQKQSEYIHWKYLQLKNFILSKPRKYDRNQSFIVRTISHPYLSQLHKVFYPKGKKIIPNNIREYLKSPLTIAVWYMDDGNIRKTNNKVYGYYLNTQSFSYSENKKLAHAMKYNFGINCSILRNKGYYRLYIGIDRNKFSDLVGEYVIPSMRYKIG